MSKKHGEWIELPNGWDGIDEYLRFECSVCHREVHNNFPYCPFCAADMRENPDDTDSSVDEPAQERTHGHWIAEIDGETVYPNNIGFVSRAVKCSKCGWYLAGSSEYTCKGNFCPSCGSDMRKEKTE